MRRFASPLFAATAGAVVSAIIVGGVAIAQTSTSTVITACVAENSGNVRIVGNSSDCKSNETMTSWNQQGPQGAPGTNGANGVSGWTQVLGEPTTVDAHTWAMGRATCLDGKKVLGGGYLGEYYGDIRTTPYVLTPFGSVPGIGGSDWQVYMINDTPAGIPFRAYAICAFVS